MPSEVERKMLNCECIVLLLYYTFNPKGNKKINLPHSDIHLRAHSNMAASIVASHVFIAIQLWKDDDVRQEWVSPVEYSP